MKIKSLHISSAIDCDITIEKEDGTKLTFSIKDNLSTHTIDELYCKLLGLVKEYENNVLTY